MPGHKFHIGEIVELERSMLRSASGGVYKVTKRLPKSDAGVQDQEHQRAARARRTGK